MGHESHWEKLGKCTNIFLKIYRYVPGNFYILLDFFVFDISWLAKDSRSFSSVFPECGASFWIRKNPY